MRRACRGTRCTGTEGLRTTLRLAHRIHVADVRWFEHCAGKGDLHFPGWPHGSVDWFRDFDVGFFASSLASCIERLRSLNRLETTSTSTMRSAQLAWRGLEGMKSTFSEAHRPVKVEGPFKRAHCRCRAARLSPASCRDKCSSLLSPSSLVGSCCLERRLIACLTGQTFEKVNG